MEKIVKILLIFWGIVFVTVGLKYVSTLLPNKIDFSFSDYINTDTISKALHISTPDNSENENLIYFPLQKRYGLNLQGYEGCIKDFTAGKHEKGFNYSTNSMCMNGNCELNVEFEEKIPKKIKLYIKNNDDCSLKEFKVPKTLDEIGYFVNLQLSPIQKVNLDIHTGDKIRLEQANGYSLSGSKQYYFYDTPIDKDNIVVNDTIVGEVFFNKNASHEQTTQAYENKVKKEVKINIPHPKELYTYTCDSNLLCKKEANTYIVNIDGVDFIPSEKFILTCLSNIQSNKFCTFFTKIGDTSSMKFNSKAMMDSYINMSKNPEFNDSFKTWEQKRLETAKQKIKNKK